MTPVETRPHRFQSAAAVPDALCNCHARRAPGALQRLSHGMRCFTTAMAQSLADATVYGALLSLVGLVVGLVAARSGGIAWKGALTLAAAWFSLAFIAGQVGCLLTLALMRVRTRLPGSVD